MRVVPVTLVNNGISNNLENTNFGSRKKANVTSLQNSTVGVKAIPVAVLIAMSPLNNQQMLRANEPFEHETEFVEPKVYEVDQAKKDDYVPVKYLPKPDNWKYLGDARLEGYPNNPEAMVAHLKFYDTVNTGGKKITMVEYTRYAFGKVMERGIIKGVEENPTQSEYEQHGKALPAIQGVRLDTKDLSNYAPKRRVMNDEVTRLMITKLKDILNMNVFATGIIDVPYDSDARNQSSNYHLWYAWDLGDIKYTKGYED